MTDTPADPIAAEARDLRLQFTNVKLTREQRGLVNRLMEIWSDDQLELCLAELVVLRARNEALTARLQEIGKAHGERQKSAGRAEEKERTMKIGNREVKVREDSTPFCAFCGKVRAEVKRIINGPTVGICNDCIELLASMIGIERSPQGPARPAEASAWRPISEVQPRDVVLVWDNGTLSRDPGMKVWRAGSQKITTPGITHWMPLPSPPEGGE